MRTGAASARSRSPAVSRTSRGGRSGNGGVVAGRVVVLLADVVRQSGNRFHYGARIHARPRMSTLRVPSLGCSPVASIIDTVANLAKRRGLVFQSGEIYGGTKSAWDYGPLGVELKENIKRQWWRSVVTSRDDVVGLDSVDHPAARSVGGLRPRRGVPRPAGRVADHATSGTGRPHHEAYEAKHGLRRPTG